MYYSPISQNFKSLDEYIILSAKYCDKEVLHINGFCKPKLSPLLSFPLLLQLRYFATRQARRSHAVAGSPLAAGAASVCRSRVRLLAPAWHWRERDVATWPCHEVAAAVEVLPPGGVPGARAARRRRRARRAYRRRRHGAHRWRPRRRRLLHRRLRRRRRRRLPVQEAEEQ